MAIKWGLSVLDWQAHAIDEGRYHPVGVYKAECDHLLMMVTALHDRPPGRVCPTCAARWSRPGEQQQPPPNGVSERSR